MRQGRCDKGKRDLEDSLLLALKVEEGAVARKQPLDVGKSFQKKSALLTP